MGKQKYHAKDRSTGVEAFKPEELLEIADPEMAIKYELMRAEYYRSRNMDKLEAKALDNIKFWQDQME